MWETEQFWGTIDFHSMFSLPGYKLTSKYLPLYSAEQRNSWQNFCIFGWTIPLNWEIIITKYVILSHNDGRTYSSGLEHNLWKNQINHGLVIKYIKIINHVS